MFPDELITILDYIDQKELLAPDRATRAQMLYMGHTWHAAGI